MQKILVIGEALIDEIYHPEEESSQTLVGGSPANVAKGLARLGCNIELASWLGADEYGKIIAQELERDGVNLPQSIFHANNTSVARAKITADGSADYDFKIDWQLPTMPAATEVDWIHTGSIATVLEPGASQLLNYLCESCLPILSFDPNIRPQIITDPQSAKNKIVQFFRWATVVKMSDEDAQWLYPGYSGSQIWEILKNLGVQIFALTKGEKGAEIWGPVDSHCSQSNHPCQLVDTVGAGDSFMAALIYGIRAVLAAKNSTNLADINQTEQAKILDFCLKVAARTVSRAGANPPSLKEILATEK